MLAIDTRSDYYNAMSTREITLPNYTEGQEIANSLSHAAGALLCLLGFPFLIVKAAMSHNAWAIVGCSLFFFGALITYLGSAIYHGLPKSDTKKVWRVMDHCNIFFLIIGTYSPYCLVALREYSLGWAWSIYGIVVFFGILGIILNAIDLKKFAVLSMIDYLFTGWAIIISFYPLTASIGFMNGTFLLLLGGISYTIGAVLYGIGGKKNQWFHFIFHLFVLLGTVLMFFSVYFYVI